MIFVTVGTQLPFDRLIGAIDQWSGQHPDVKIFAQIGPSELAANNIETASFVSPEKAEKLFEDSSLIVAHAGMGSILSAIKYCKPILIMPRKAALGEHRNDHQIATAKWLESRSGVFVAWDEKELVKLLNQRNLLSYSCGESSSSSRELIERMRNFINQ